MEPEKFTSSKNGVEHTFLFTYNIEFHTKIEFYIYRFEIWQEGIKPTSILLKIMSTGTDLKVIDLYPSEPYRGKGISIAFILKMKNLLKKRIISSSHSFPTHSGEDRWLPATQYVWKPMLEKGLAGYNAQYDYYYTL